jgi:hypothetical protein
VESKIGCGGSLSGSGAAAGLGLPFAQPVSSLVALPLPLVIDADCPSGYQKGSQGVLKGIALETIVNSSLSRV